MSIVLQWSSRQSSLQRSCLSGADEINPGTLIIRNQRVCAELVFIFFSSLAQNSYAQLLLPFLRVFCTDCEQYVKYFLFSCRFRQNNVVMYNRVFLGTLDLLPEMNEAHHDRLNEILGSVYSKAILCLDYIFEI